MINLVTSPAFVTVFVGISWVSAGALVFAAWQATPRIGALNERAQAAVLISIILTLFVIVSANVDLGFPLWDIETGRHLLRLGVLALSLIGPTWLYLWLTGRLGDGN